MVVIIHVTDDHKHELKGILMSQLRHGLSATKENVLDLMNDQITLENLSLFEDGSLIDNHIWFYNEYLNALKRYAIKNGMNFDALTYKLAEQELVDIVIP